MKSNTQLQSAIMHVINYFAYFNFAPSEEQIYRFLPIKVEKKEMQSVLRKMVEKSRLFASKCAIKKIKCDFFLNKNNCLMNTICYTLPHKKDIFREKKKRFLISKTKVYSILDFVRFLSFFPQIQLVGLSGSVAMMNAKENDDIDFFIISSPKRLWTARFIAVFLAEAMRIRRKRCGPDIADKVCLNLFFDGADVEIPDVKKNEYVAHELIQMLPIYIRVTAYNNVYRRFLSKNKWVFDFFPNIKLGSLCNNSCFFVHKKTKLAFFRCVSFKGCFILKPVADLLEFILKKIQLKIINRHRTAEFITNSQLWFFPEDVEKKLRNEKIIK